MTTTKQDYKTVKRIINSIDVTELKEYSYRGVNLIINPNTDTYKWVFGIPAIGWLYNSNPEEKITRAGLLRWAESEFDYREDCENNHIKSNAAYLANGNELPY